MHPVVTYNIAYIADIIGVRVYEEPPDIMMAKTVPICLHHIKSLTYSRGFYIISSRRQWKKSYFKPGHFSNLAYISEMMVYLLKHPWIIY